MIIFFAGVAGGDREYLLIDNNCSRMFSYHYHGPVNVAGMVDFEVWMEDMDEDKNDIPEY